MSAANGYAATLPAPDEVVGQYAAERALARVVRDSAGDTVDNLAENPEYVEATWAQFVHGAVSALLGTLDPVAFDEAQSLDPAVVEAYARVRDAIRAAGERYRGEEA